MSRSMGFRNSGALDLRGKGTEIGLVAILAGIIVLAVVVVIGQVRSKTGGAIEAPNEFRVKCLNPECNEEWMVGRKEVMQYQREEERGMLGGDCPKCQTKGSVFVMTQCPECGTYYMSKQITDPRAFAAGKVRDVCPNPKCKTDLIEWHKERMKKRR